MRLKMISRDRRIAIREARPVVHIGRHVAAPRETQGAAEVQGIALIVVEQKKTAGRREIRQSSSDCAEALGNLIRVCHVYLAAILDAWRADRELPAHDVCSINRQRKENVGVSDVAVIKIIPRARLKRVR